MSMRWLLGPPRWAARSLPVSQPATRSVSMRLSSSTSDQSRKFPGSEKRSRLRPWQRAFIIGIGGGFVTGQALLYYDRNQKKNSFVTYKLVAKEPVSSTASIFHLQPQTATSEFGSYKEAWRQGIWNVHFKQPQIQIVRAYTPLPPLLDNKEQDGQNLRFLIRHDPFGEVSSYLHRLPIGADIELRGPNLEYSPSPDIQQVVFFAGGTGIAPALQVAHAMFDAQTSEGLKEGSSDQRKRKLHILWANRKREDCVGGNSDAPLANKASTKPSWSGILSQQKAKPDDEVGNEKGLVVQELEALKKRHPGQITVEYFVNAEDSWINENVVFQTLSRFDSEDFSTGYPTSKEQRQILISGPSGFISYLAGPKEWVNGREDQGSVSKIIAHAIAQNPQHVKVWKV